MPRRVHRRMLIVCQRLGTATAEITTRMSHARRSLMKSRQAAQNRLGRVAIVVVIAVASAVAIIPSRDAPARATADVAMVNHPIVGAWWWENISGDPFDDSYAVFGSDGTYVEETSYIGAGIGSWQTTGDRSGDLLIIYQDIEG